MIWTLPVLVLGLVLNGIYVLGLVALVVRDLGLVVFFCACSCRPIVSIATL